MGPWDTTNQILKSVLVKAHETSSAQEDASQTSSAQKAASKRVGAMATAMTGGKDAFRTYLAGNKKSPERIAYLKARRAKRLAASAGGGEASKLAASDKEAKAAQRKKWAEAERSGKAVRVGTRHYKDGKIVAETGEPGGPLPANLEWPGPPTAKERAATAKEREALIADVTAGHAPSKKEHAAMQERNLAPAIGLEGRWGVPRKKARFVEKVGSIVHAVNPVKGDKTRAFATPATPSSAKTR